MAEQRLGIIMNGVTGRMGMNQHLVRSILAIREQGRRGARATATRVMPDPILVGRNAGKLAQLANAHGIARWTTDLDAALDEPDDTLFFDAATTQLRAELLQQGDRRRQAHLLREADRGRTSATRSRSRARPRRPASSTASCRTSCSCPGCSSCAP